VLRAIGRRKKTSFRTQEIQSKVNPEIIKKLGVNYRIFVLRALARSNKYPFTHKVSTDKFHELVFPCMFQESIETKKLMQTWEAWQLKIPQELPEYK
jgi:hypothetical protein